MTAHETDTDFIVFFSAEELEAFHLTPELLTRQQVLSVLRAYLSQMKKSLPLYPEIELFASKAGVLVFIRPTFDFAPNSSIYRRVFS